MDKINNMCLLRFFKKKKDVVNDKSHEELILLIDYELSSDFSHNSKRHLWLCGTIYNGAIVDKKVKIRILPKGEMINNIVKSRNCRTPQGRKIFNTFPEKLYEATITEEKNNPIIVKSKSEISFSLLVVEFNVNDKMSISISYDGFSKETPIDYNKIKKVAGNNY